MSSLQKQQISTLVKMLMNEVPNFASNQPSLLPNVNTVSAQPMKQGKEWNVSLTPNNRNRLVHTM